MRVTKENERLFLWLSKEEFLQLEENTPAIERFAYDVMNEKGYLNLILDFPIGKVIAVLDAE